MNRLIRVVGLAVFWGAAQMSPAAEFFVAVEGDDANAGTQVQPFATLTRAQLAVRKLLAYGYGENVLISLGSGVYFLDKPLHFSAADSGRGEQNMTYRGVTKEGRMATISGGRVLSDWNVRADSKWQTEAAVTETSPRLRQLFADGQRLPRGRFPNEDKMLTILESDDALKKIVVAEPFPSVQFAAGQGELVVHSEWGIARAPVTV